MNENHICGTCRHFSFKAEASRAIGECLRPRFYDLVRVIPSEPVLERMGCPLEIAQMIRIRVDEQFGCRLWEPAREGSEDAV